MSSKAVRGWGSLNVALNGLVKDGTIAGYETGAGADGAVTVQVKIQSGADQADVVRRVREVLPEAFASAEVRTRAA